MAKGRATLEWDQTSLLWSQQANLNRDPKDTPKPYLPSVVHPYRTDADYEAKDEPREKMIGAIKRTCRIRRMNNVNSHRSREGISPAAGRE